MRRLDMEEDEVWQSVSQSYCQGCWADMLHIFLKMQQSVSNVNWWFTDCGQNILQAFSSQIKLCVNAVNKMQTTHLHLISAG